MSSYRMVVAAGHLEDFVTKKVCDKLGCFLSWVNDATGPRG